MVWLSPTIRQRRPGTPGVIVILADATGSISPVNKARICEEAEHILWRERSARLWAFGTAVVDITSDPSAIKRPIWDCFPGMAAEGFDWRKSRGTEGTYIGRALAAAAQLDPERTIVLSDGGTADRADTFRIADAMTGAIDAWWCRPVREEYDLAHFTISADDLWRHYSRGADKSLMQELARRGGGVFGVYPAREGIYSSHGRRESTMRRPIHISGTAVNINAPQAEVHRVGREIHVIHQDTIHHHHLPPEEIHHGEAAPIDIDIGQAQVNVARPDGHVVKDHRPALPPRGFLGAFLLGPRKSEVVPAQQEEYRGTLQTVSNPGPSSGHPALPTTSQPRLARPGGVVVRSSPKKVR